MIEPMYISILSDLQVEIEKENINFIDIIRQIYNEISLHIPVLELEQLIFSQFFNWTKKIFEDLLNITKFDTIEQTIERLQNGNVLLDSFFLLIKYLDESILEILNIKTFAYLIIDLLILSYRYCKACSDFFENEINSISSNISTFYEKTYKLQIIFLNLLSKVQISTPLPPKEQECLNTICQKLGNLNDVVIVLETSISIEIWKYIMNILKIFNLNDETLINLFNNINLTFIDCTKKLKEIFVDNAIFKISEISKMELSLLRTSCFFWKNLVYMFNLHSRIATPLELQEIIRMLQNLFVILYSINCEESMNEKVDPIILYMKENIDLLIFQLIQIPHLKSYILETECYDENSFPDLTIQIYLFKAIAEANDDIIKYLMANSFQLIPNLFNSVQSCKNKLEFCNQKIISYSLVCEVLLKLLLSMIKQEELATVENHLLEALLNNNIYIHIMAVDLWICISRILGNEYTINLCSSFLNLFPIESKPDLSSNENQKSNYDESLYASKIIYLLQKLIDTNELNLKNFNQQDNKIVSIATNFSKYFSHQKIVDVSNYEKELTTGLIVDNNIKDKTFSEAEETKLDIKVEEDVLKVAELECSKIKTSLLHLVSIQHLDVRVIESNRLMLETFVKTLNVLLN